MRVLRWFLPCVAATAACEPWATLPEETQPRMEANWTPPASSTVLRFVDGIPSVRVVDAQGAPVENYEVHFVVTRPVAGALLATTTTDADGVAVLARRWFLGSVAGRQELSAFSSIGDGLRVAYSIEATPDTAASMELIVALDELRFVGDSTRPALVFRDFYANVTEPPGPVVYALSDSLVLGASNGWLYALGPGTSIVIARSGGIADTVEVTVRP